MASAGEPDPDLLASLIAHPFLEEPPPKSTGREVFGPSFVLGLARERGLQSDVPGRGWDDLMATFTEFTAQSVVRAYRHWIVPRSIDEVVVTGGGGNNPELVRRIREAIHPVPVRTGSAALGMDPDAREAAAFAVLAWAHLMGYTSNLPSVTGAKGPRILGSLTPGPVRRAE